MTSFHKYYLVDPDKYNLLVESSKKQVDNSSDILQHPNVKAVQNIDNKISKIFHNSASSDVEKMDEYNGQLDSYIRNFRNALEVPKRDALLGSKRNHNDEIEPHSSETVYKPASSDVKTKPLMTSSNSFLDTAEKPPDNYSFSSIIDSIPPSYKPYVQHLSSFLQRNKNFEIDKNGALKYKGVRAFKSNAGNLLEDAVRYKKPLGNTDEVNSFVSKLKEEGYPVVRLGYVKRLSKQNIDKLKELPKIQKRKTKHNFKSTRNLRSKNSFKTILNKWETIE